MRRRWEKRWKRGSFTVEASLLFPLLLFLFCGFLCLCMYWHDRCLFVASASELAGKGALMEYEKQEELEAWLKEEAKNLVGERLLTVREYEAEVEVTMWKITVGYTGTTPLLGGLELREQESARRQNPVTYIRGSRQLEAWVEE